MTDTTNTPGDLPEAASARDFEEIRETPPLPLGYWLRAVDALIGREFRAALAGEDLDRRDWMLLNAVSGDIDAPAWLAARLQGRGGKRLRALAERGWVERGEDSWTLTDEGRAARERLAGIVDGIRERVSGAVSPEDYATLTASLETIARELGWDEKERMGQPGRHGRPDFGPGRGFGPGFRPGFGPRFGPGFGPGFGPAFGPGFGRGFGPAQHDGEHGDAPEDCGRRMRGRHDRGHGRHHHRGERHAERAFERGFDAGFRAAKERAQAS